tara:strand:+ start:2230 stop:2454 length:225 start_codon:yes stop_codon:yes gene_type:complete
MPNSLCKPYKKQNTEFKLKRSLVNAYVTASVPNTKIQKSEAMATIKDLEKLLKKYEIKWAKYQARQILGRLCKF